MEKERTSSLDTLMKETVERVREMADTNHIVGTPITTVDGVTLIPVSRISVGFASGGGSYGKNAKDGFAGAGTASVKIDPVAFLTVRDGLTRILPVGYAPINTVDRIIDMVPDIAERVENYFDQKKDKVSSDGES